MNFLRRLWTPTVQKITRVLWVSAVIVFVVLWSIEHREEITDLGSNIGLVEIFLIVIVTLGGKFVVSEQGRVASELVGHSFTTRQMFWMYSSSDIAKYIPGGIWNAVSRVKIYRDQGMSMGASTRAFTLEKFWQVTGAFYVGVFFILPSLQNRWNIIPEGSLSLIVCYFLAGIFWIGTTLIGNHFISSERDPLRAALRAFSDQTFIAILLGLGLWIPLESIGSADLALSIGAFSIGRAAGYVAVFAPAGVGVRELVSLWVLGATVPESMALIALGANRILTGLTDFMGFGIAAYYCRPSSSNGSETNEEHDG